MGNGLIFGFSFCFSAGNDGGFMVGYMVLKLSGGKWRKI